MPFPIKTCAICKEEFELKPDKPGFANRCPQCSEEASDSATDSATRSRISTDERKTTREANEARRQAMRNLLYRRDS